MHISKEIRAVEAHAGGEPGRVIVSGVSDVPGATMYEKMVHLRDHADGLRLLMLREPRGYPAANCNVILPSSHPEADAGFVIMEQVEYPGMSGTNTICVATVPDSFISSRSADSWIGVSGFLISWASRRATSPQACARWAQP